jgi:hypothetical protein
MCRWEDPKDPSSEMLLLYAWRTALVTRMQRVRLVFNSIVNDADSGQKITYPKTNANAKNLLSHHGQSGTIYAFIWTQPFRYRNVPMEC